jgi:peptide deformylase
MKKMSVRKIVLMGNPALRGVAEPIQNPSDDDVARLAEDMKDTLAAIDANGLAAPQVEVGRRLVVYRLPASRIPEGSGSEPVPWTAMVNPVIEPLSDRRQMIWERCLSLPGLFGKVSRHLDIRIRFTDLEGERQERTAHGFHSMLLQHECDHLDGVLYPMRIADIGTEFAFAAELGTGLTHFRYSADEYDGVVEGGRPTRA